MEAGCQRSIAHALTHKPARLLTSAPAPAPAPASAQVKVCVPDSGLAFDHPDIQGSVLDGWNLVPTDGSGGVVQPDDPDYKKYGDVRGHGTGVAGIIAARTNNGVGIASAGGSAVRGRRGCVGGVCVCGRGEGGELVYAVAWGEGGSLAAGTGHPSQPSRGEPLFKGIFSLPPCR